MWVLKKIWYRIYHGAFKIGVALLPFKEPEIVAGIGSSKKIATLLTKRSLAHALIVTDETLLQLGLLDQLFDGLKENDIFYTLYSNVTPDPTIEMVEEVRDLYKYSGADSIVAFGGGSSIDCAKAAGAICTNKKSLKKMAGYLKVFRSIPPLFAVPTTAGTGSEVTIAAVITDAALKQKFLLVDLHLTPVGCALDPSLMVGLPQHITAATGMDALTHAVEAYIGVHKMRYTDRHAEKATALIFDCLERVYRDGNNIELRQKMSEAAYSAGCAFTRSSVGYVHAVAHNLGGLYKVPHGLANAIVLPTILRWFGKSIYRNLATLARKTNVVAGGLPVGETAELFIQKIEELNARLDIPSHVKELQETDIPFLAERILKEGNPSYPVARIMHRKECEELLRSLLK